MKKLVAILISVVIYFALMYTTIFLPHFMEMIANCFGIQNKNVAIIGSVILLMIISSDKVYGKLHLFYCKIYKKFPNFFVKMLAVTLISFNDFIIAIPKRTLIFTGYLILTIAAELGYTIESEINFMLIGVLLIGIDRVFSNFNKENKKMLAWGEKAYGETGSILDDLRDK